MTLIRLLLLMLLLFSAVVEPERADVTDWDAMGFYSAWEDVEAAK